MRPAWLTRRPGRARSLVADGLSDGEFAVAAETGVVVDPAVEVVGEGGAGQPGGVGGEAPRGQVRQAGARLEVADGQFDVACWR